jgi:hypothetical protein
MAKPSILRAVFGAPVRPLPPIHSPAGHGMRTAQEVSVKSKASSPEGRARVRAIPLVRNS